jgi:predicted transposase YdaD
MEESDEGFKIAFIAVAIIAGCSVLSNIKLRKQLKKSQKVNIAMRMRSRKEGHMTDLEVARCLDQAHMRIALKMREPCVTVEEIEAVVREENEFLDIVRNQNQK